MWDGVTLDSPYTTTNTQSNPNNTRNGCSTGSTSSEAGIDVDTFHINWVNSWLLEGDTTAWINLHTNGNGYVTVYTRSMNYLTHPDKKLSPDQREKLLGILKTRFDNNMDRHPGLDWADIQAKLETGTEKLWSLNEMENTGGEPDVVGYDKKSGAYVFCDCSIESPVGRRNLCYDREALAARKEHKPPSSARDMASAMGIELLTEEQYRELQRVGNFDTKTSSWLKTPSEIRKLGGALFGDRRYNTVFVYHNSADSYYAARGFRGLLKV